MLTHVDMIMRFSTMPLFDLCLLVSSRVECSCFGAETLSISFSSICTFVDINSSQIIVLISEHESTHMLGYVVLSSYDSCPISFSDITLQFVLHHGKMCPSWL